MPIASKATLVVNGQEVPNITSFSYTDDIRQLGNPFAVRIPDPKGTYAPVVTKGQPVQLYLSNPAVNNGAQTPKIRGRIRQVKQSSENGTGRVLDVVGSDLGYHLTKSCGNLWFNLQTCTYQKLLNQCIETGQRVTSPAPGVAVTTDTWGFQGVRFDNNINRRLKLGRAQALLSLPQNQNVLVPLQYIGIEPGETLADVLINACRRNGLLVNVSCDGYIQCWNPDYTQAPLYTLRYAPLGQASGPAQFTDIDRVEVQSDADPIFDDVTCVWEVLQQDITAPGNQAHPGQYRANYRDDTVLPFRAPLTFADGDPLSSSQAKRRATWRSKQGQYEGWTYSCRVGGHQQGGIYWETDTVVSLDDTVNYDDVSGGPIRGNFYVAAMTQTQDNQKGDVTYLTIKRPNLLAAL